MLKIITLILPLFILISCNSNKKQVKINFPKTTYKGIEKLFLKYKTPVKFSKLSTQLDMKSLKGWKRYKQYVINGAKKKVNFGGKFILIQWSCGTECVTGVIVDASTGKFKRIPTSEWGFGFRKNSVLLIVNPPSKGPEKNIRPAYAYPAYYVWKNKAFTLLHDTRKLK